MYNLDNFSYWKEPIVRIKRIGIYPLDDEGRAKYYSKNSYTHHYLHETNPSAFKQLIMNTEPNEREEDKILNQNDESNNLNTLSSRKPNEGLGTEPNQINTLKNSIGNKVIESNTINNNLTLNKRYMNNIKKKNIKLKNIKDLRYKSNSKANKTKNFYHETEINNKEKNIDLRKISNEKANRKISQSLDKSARLTGLRIFKNIKAKENPKLPLIMGGFNHVNNNIIKNIRSDPKEMGETYNPYNFIAPHVNRTKRNYLGALFHH